MSINQASLVILATLSLSFTCIISDQVDWIPAVCSNDDGGFCNQTLSTNCSTNRYVLKLMGQCITAVAINATKNAKHVLSSNGVLKNFTRDCPESFGSALENLRAYASVVKNISTIGTASKKNIDDLKAEGSAAMTDLNTCKDDLDDVVIEPEKQNVATDKKLKDAFNKLNVTIVYANKVISVLLLMAKAIKEQ